MGFDWSICDPANLIHFLTNDRSYCNPEIFYASTYGKTYSFQLDFYHTYSPSRMRDFYDSRIYDVRRERVKRACNSRECFLKRTEPEKGHQQVAVKLRKGPRCCLRIDFDNRRIDWTFHKHFRKTIFQPLPKYKHLWSVRGALYSLLLLLFSTIIISLYR